MPDMEDCEICLDSLSGVIGTLTCCPKDYHYHCIRQWSTHSNSCPQCRLQFNHIMKIDSTGPMKIPISTASQQKLINQESNPAGSILENTIQNAGYANVTLSGVCVVCSLSDYRRGLQCQPVNCLYCGLFFHFSCLGLAQIKQDSWFCPVCDVEQPKPGVNRFDPILRFDYEFNDATRFSEGGLIVSSEVGDDRCIGFDEYMSDEEMTRSYPSRINGGMLQRREQEAQKHLSAEEKWSWEGFDQIRNNVDDIVIEGSSRDSAPSETSKPRRKRKKTTRVEQETLLPVSTDAEQTQSSRITSLLNQVKQNSSRKYNQIQSSAVTVRLPPVRPLSPGPALSPAPTMSPSPQMTPHLSPDAPTRYVLSGATSPPESDTDSAPIADLTMDQKLKIQDYIRQLLRPLYKPSGKQRRRPLIVLLDHYCDINKRISHIVYAEVKHLPLFPEVFTDDPEKIQRIVARVVQDELKG